MSDRRIIPYTSLCGDIDSPRDDILCFSQYDRFHDNRLNAKIYKILPHLFLPDHEWSIYIDANMFLRKTPEDLVALAAGHDMAVWRHPLRRTVAQEAEECRRLKKDSEKNIVAALVEHDRPDTVPLAMCGAIIRRNVPSVHNLCESWWSKICVTSRRDQLTFPSVAKMASVVMLPAVKNINDCDYWYLVKHGGQGSRSR